jgi:serine/threonine-protein kinase
MATVYLADDLRHHRKVAVKVLDPAIASTLGTQRFLREIETAANLVHPHILPVHDSGEADGHLYYVMPYVDGESLKQRLEGDVRLPIPEALRIAREVADALTCAHNSGVVHRDIKPANILLEAGHAVVADFGIARAAGGGDDIDLTGTGAWLGSPQYMSPEQAAGARDVGPASDQYSLACVLFEMLAGEPPFSGSSAPALIARRLTEAPRPVSESRADAPTEVVAALERALSTEPAHRFASVEDFAQALSAAPLGGGHGKKRLRRTGGSMARWALPAAVVLAAAVALTQWSRTNGSEVSHPLTTLAVLPLQVTGAELEQEALAGGLHEALLTQLGKVEGLTVIARRAVMQYASGETPLEEIRTALSVGSVVDASIRFDGNRLRVAVYLLDTETGTQLWAQDYDRTVGDVFAMQRDIAQSVVAELGVHLTASEAAQMNRAPTSNAEAYEFYLLGRDYYSHPTEQESLEIAQSHFERAVALDGDFALARAWLALVHSTLFRFYDPTPDRMQQLRRTAELAVASGPELPESRLAMAQWYRLGLGDLRNALRESTLASQGMPNESEVWQWLGALHRQMGDYESALAAGGRAIEVDPTNEWAFYDILGVTYWFTHQWPEAIENFRHAREMRPDLKMFAVDEALMHFFWTGQLDSIRAVLADIPAHEVLGYHLDVALHEWAQLLLLERRPDSLITMVERAGVAAVDGQGVYAPSTLYVAWAHSLKGDSAAAYGAFQTSLALVDSALVEAPDHWGRRAARGLALAGLNRQQEALAEAAWLESAPAYTEDAFMRRLIQEQQAMILAQAGAADAALDLLAQLTVGPSPYVTTQSVRLHPIWDPLREHPRFQALVGVG